MANRSPGNVTFSRFFTPCVRAGSCGRLTDTFGHRSTFWREGLGDGCPHHWVTRWESCSLFRSWSWVLCSVFQFFFSLALMMNACSVDHTDKGRYTSLNTVYHHLLLCRHAVVWNLLYSVSLRVWGSYPSHVHGAAERCYKNMTSGPQTTASKELLKKASELAVLDTTELRIGCTSFVLIAWENPVTYSWSGSSADRKQIGCGIAHDAFNNL